MLPDPNPILDAFDGPAGGEPEAPPELDASALDQLRWMATNAKNETARVSALRVLLEHEPKTPQVDLDAATALAVEVSEMSTERLERDLTAYSVEGTYTRAELDKITRARSRHEAQKRTRHLRDSFRERRQDMDREISERVARLVGRRFLGDGAEVVDAEIVDDEGRPLPQLAPPGIPNNDPSVIRPARRYHL